jgi:hypothetical protein
MNEYTNVTKDNQLQREIIVKFLLQPKLYHTTWFFCALLT